MADEKKVVYNKNAERIENNFVYHTPTDRQIAKMADIRLAARDFAKIIDEHCPESREKSLALTQLEDCVMWGNASIVRNE